MLAFRIVLVILALLPLLTGAADMLLGVAGQTLLGVQLDEEALSDSVLDSQFRFLATIWFGLGLLLCLCAWRPLRYPNVLRGVLGVILLGGVARVLSIIQTGLPETGTGTAFVLLAIGVELIGMPLLLFWHAQVDRAARRAAREQAAGY